ncbi:rubrerythrin family protein [Candidatus Woesearchaeota archaeon]|nr:MAG: rubrerythrin family protein [Candidatus Woesearchaeota archaeon]
MDFQGLIKKWQREELTEHYIYARLSKTAKQNADVLIHLSKDKLLHYDVWKRYTKQDLPSKKFMFVWYLFLSKIFGLVFTLKLMQKRENKKEHLYLDIVKAFPELQHLLKLKDAHEEKLISIVHEEHLDYVGSMVLGLNDALVELTGALAGLSFALQKTRLIALAGLITGVAAALSMASAEFLSKKSEQSQKAGKSAAYTGLIYFITVIFLVVPYFIFSDYKLALLVTILINITVIAIFTYFLSVAKDLSFKKRFGEMATISLGVTAISFLIGLFLKAVLHIEV